MNINDLTYREIKQLMSIFNNNAQTDKSHPFDIGENYFIRTVTHYLTGRLVGVFETELVIEDAAWIPDTGRYHQFLEASEPQECEPYPEGKLVIGRGSIIDAFKIARLPRKVK